jgi:hypothetical protein
LRVVESLGGVKPWSGNTVMPDGSSKNRIGSMHYIHNAAVFYYNCAGGGDQMESNQILSIGLEPLVSW